MPLSKDQLDQFIIAHHDDQETSYRYALYVADLNGHFAQDEDWGALCERMDEIDIEHAMSEEFVAKFEQAADPLQALEYALYDNYLLAAFAAKRMGLIQPGLPLMAQAAFNKNRYPGLKGGEFALVRLLHWMGCDVNARAGDGRTALHLFASMNPPPYSNPRAVQWLIDHGADANVADARGDTPLIYMAASIRWTQDLSDSFVILMNADADEDATSDDGSTALSLFVENDQKAPHEQRQEIIDILRSRMAGAQAEGGETAPAPL